MAESIRDCTYHAALYKSFSFVPRSAQRCICSGMYVIFFVKINVLVRSLVVVICFWWSGCGELSQNLLDSTTQVMISSR